MIKAVAYNNEKTLIECKPLQFYIWRGQPPDIVEVTLTEWNRSKVDFNEDSPVVITLFFKKKQDGPAQKYIKMGESVEHDL